jgi:hypothetical protein
MSASRHRPYRRVKSLAACLRLMTATAAHQHTQQQLCIEKAALGPSAPHLDASPSTVRQIDFSPPPTVDFNGDDDGNSSLSAPSDFCSSPPAHDEHSVDAGSIIQTDPLPPPVVQFPSLGSPDSPRLGLSKEALPGAAQVPETRVPEGTGTRSLRQPQQELRERAPTKRPRNREGTLEQGSKRRKRRRMAELVEAEEREGEEGDAEVLSAVDVAEQLRNMQDWGVEWVGDPIPT